MLPSLPRFWSRVLPIGVAICCSVVRLPAEVVVVESRTGGQNIGAYTEGTGNWQNSTAKSTAPGTTAGIGSRFCTADGGTFTVTPTLTVAGGNYIVEVTHPTSSNIPTNLLASVTVTGGTGLPANTSTFNQYSANVWRVVGTLTLDPGVTTPSLVFAKLAGSAGAGQRFYTDALRFTWADDPGLQTPQIPTVNGPLAAGQTFVDVPTVLSNATTVIVYADGTEIGRRNSGIDGGVERVTTGPLAKGQVITATQIGTNGIESLRPATGALVGGGASPRVRISLSIRQSPTLTGPIGANGGTTNTPIFFLGAWGTFNGGWGLAPTGGKVFDPGNCWQTVTFERGPDPAHPIDSTFAWSGSQGTNELHGDFGVLDAIAFAIEDTGDTGPFRVYIDDLKNGDVLVQGFESASNTQEEVLFRKPGSAGASFTTWLLAQPPGSFTPNAAEVTDAFSYDGNQSLYAGWQYLNLSGGNWVRLLATGSGTPNPQLDLRKPISFRMLLLPVGVTHPPVHVCEQPLDACALQTQGVTLEVRALGTKPIAYQWYFQGTPLAGQTNRTLTIPSGQTADSGLYRVVVTDATGAVTSNYARVTVEPTAFTGVMESMWRLAPGDRPYLAADGQQGGLAYDRATSNLVLVTRTGGDAVILLNGETGAEAGSLYLDPMTVAGGEYLVNKAATTPDGSLYVCNMTPNSGADSFRIYHWAAVATGAPPTDVAWQGDPGAGAGGRWGDTLALRQADIDGTLYPEFAVAAQGDHKIAVLRPWTSSLFFTLADVPAGAFDDGLAWGESNTVWGKSYQGHLYQIGLDITNGTAEVLHAYTNLPTLAPIGIDIPNRLMGAVSFASPDALRLFSLTDPAAGPAPLDAEFFPVDDPWTATAGAVAFGPDRMYGLSPNQGIVSMRIYLPLLLGMSKTNNVLWLQWAGPGTLQSAPSADGVYVDTGETNSPSPVNMSGQAQQFFRVRK